ncbi:MAG: hypothetical protein IJ695_07235 [Butyrivibrio sp.]|nr:hypothetical protein [Butyrivibrio sp.]
MGKNDKELEQISTTDKLKAMKALRDAGLKVEMSGSGVPTVICAAASDIEKELKNVRRILKEMRYNGSFGVRAPRKNDQVMPSESAQEIENEHEATGDDAIPA